MHDPEGSALHRAAVVLLAISVIRWGIDARSSRPEPIPADSTALADHLAATEAAADEEDRRSRELRDGERIDPNRASEVQLDRLPGIGPSTARAVVAAREAGAHFGRPDDLLAVRGIGPSTVEKIRPWLELTGDRGGPRKAPGEERVDVNRADPAALQRLPGIGPALAERIVEERSVRPFGSVDELERVRGIGPATVARLRTMATTGRNR